MSSACVLVTSNSFASWGCVGVGCGCGCGCVGCGCGCVGVGAGVWVWVGGWLGGGSSSALLFCTCTIIIIMCASLQTSTCILHHTLTVTHSNVAFIQFHEELLLSVKLVKVLEQGIWLLLGTE